MNVGKQLGLRVTNVQDFEQRQLIVQEALVGMEPVQVATCLAFWSAGPQSPENVVGLEATLGCLLAGAFPDWVVQKWLMAASSAELHHIAAALKPQLSREEHKPPVARTQIPLGYRKFLARRPSRADIDKAVRDSHPAVIANLLKNPLVTEQDVVSMAARRPNHPATLVAIARSGKWRRRYGVKKAIFYNPEAPHFLALPIGLALRNPDLVKAAEYGADEVRVTLANAVIRHRQS